MNHRALSLLIPVLLIILTGCELNFDCGRYKPAPAPKRPKLTNDVSKLMPPKPVQGRAASLKPPWTGPYAIPLAWDFVPDVSYALYVRSNMEPIFYARIPTTNRWTWVSNLWHPGFYEFAVACVTTNGIEGNVSPVVRWPQPKTNFLSMGVSARLADPWTTNSTYVMDQPSRFFRLQTNATSYALQSSPNFKQWTTDTNWPASAPLPTFYLREKHWDNVTSIEHRQ